MIKHKSEDYKISAVKYYLKNNVSLDDVSKIFNCPKQSLYRWIERYKKLKSLKRQNRKAISYKITKEQLSYAIEKLKKIIKKKFINFNITSQHLGQVIRESV